MHKNRFTCFVQSKLSNRRWVISYCKCRKNWMACISSFGEAFDKDLSEALTILLVSSNESQLSSSLTTKLWQLLCPLLHNCHLLFLVSMSLCLSFYQFFSSFYFLTSLSLSFLIHLFSLTSFIFVLMLFCVSNCLLVPTSFWLLIQFPVSPICALVSLLLLNLSTSVWQYC